jgi:hypothetical protein
MACADSTSLVRSSGNFGFSRIGPGYWVSQLGLVTGSGNWARQWHHRQVHTAFARFVCIVALLGVIAPQSPALSAPLASPTPSARLESPTPSARLKLTSESELVFASRGEGIQLLTTRDDYVSRMSRFDRMLRLKSTQPVSEEAYLDFVAANVLEWTGAEQKRLKRLVEQLRAAMQQHQLPLPSTVLAIKTTGREDVGQAHTRANAIVLPERSLAASDETLLFLLSHELFHIMSRHDANFRRRAYGLIGFRIGNEISLPGAIAPLQITNPDAPRHDSYIDVISEGRKITVVPVLLSRSAVFDPQIGTDLDHFWTLRLLVVKQVPPEGSFRAVELNGAPVLLELSRAEDFLAQVGKNTGYVIHPEEILAENFALMVTGEEVREPARLDELRRLLVPQ